MNALVLARDGVEDSEFSYPYYRLQEAGFEVTVATPDGEDIHGKRGDTFAADTRIDDRSPTEWVTATDLVVVPGGRSPEKLRVEAPSAAEIVAQAVDADVPVAAICHGIQLLISADVLADRTVTGYWTLEVDAENAGATYVDEPVVVDEPLITSRVPKDLPAFMASTFDVLDLDETVAVGPSTD